MPGEMHSHEEAGEMSDNPRNGDAERIQKARDWIAAYAKHIGGDPDTGENDWCGWACVLLRALDARDADLRERDAEIKARDHDIKRLQSSVSSARAEVDGQKAVVEQLVIALDDSQKKNEIMSRQNVEIARLRSVPAARVVEAAGEALRCTMEMAKVVGISTDALNSLSTLQHALSEYDSGFVAKEG